MDIRKTDADTKFNRAYIRLKRAQNRAWTEGRVNTAMRIHELIMLAIRRRSERRINEFRELQIETGIYAGEDRRS